VRLRNVLCILAAALQAGCGGGSDGASPLTATPSSANAVVQRTSSWQGATAFGEPASILPYGSSLAVDNAGTAWLFVSTLDSSTVTAARVYRRAAGQGWSSGEALGAPVAVGGFDRPYPLRYYERPQIALDDAGNALAVYSYRDHRDASDRNWTSQVLVHRRDAAAGSWSAPVALASMPGAYARDGRLVVEPGGAAWAVWSERTVTDASSEDRDRYAIFAAQLVAGGWSTAEKITGDFSGRSTARVTTDKRGHPRVLVAANGGLYYAARLASGSWTPLQQLTQSADEHDLAVDAEDNAIAVWKEQGVIVARRFTPGVGWENAVSLSVVELGYAHDPQLGMDAAGNAFAVWQQGYSLGTSFMIVAARFEKARGWVSRETISNQTRLGDDAASPRIAFDASGNAVAVWDKFDGAVDRTVIAANTYAAGAGWAGEETISGPDEQGALLPELAVSASGQPTATWWQEDGQGLIRPWSATRPASAGF